MLLLGRIGLTRLYFPAIWTHVFLCLGALIGSFAQAGARRGRRLSISLRISANNWPVTATSAIWEALGGVRGPTLVVRGSRSDMFAAETVDKVKATNPNVRLVEVDAAQIEVSAGLMGCSAISGGQFACA